jgi:hypothetical protein
MPAERTHASRTPSSESRGHSESAAKLLIENEASREVLSECALIRKADKLDFDSAIPKGPIV